VPDQQCRPLDARTFKDVDPASNAHEIDVNLKRVLNGTKVVIGDMSARNAGTIINISSVSERKTRGSRPKSWPMSCSIAGSCRRTSASGTSS
jgi:NAD(P)-dependent dehydrogenase (short-subunit alcohol dehydrogenase family)